jgi:catechol 2,3-dioxygenase-like lactoylglutathione lyase family enzyme
LLFAAEYSAEFTNPIIAAICQLSSPRGKRSARIDTRFLEFSVPTDDIQASLDFYRQLGFVELVVNDIRTHYYAVVTDGRIAIGLHGGGFDEPALTFISPDVSGRARSLLEAGHELDPVRLDEDTFNEVGLISPDGHALRFVEARTFSPLGTDDAPNTAIGQLSELSLRCSDDEAAKTFWEGAEFITDEDDGNSEDGLSIMRAPGMVLGLRDDLRWAEPALRFMQDDIEQTLETLDRLEITYRRRGDSWLVMAPEGTRLFIL